MINILKLTRTGSLFKSALVNKNKVMLTKLKVFLKEQKVDYFLLPNSNEFFCEYLPESEKRVQYLTGFSGSNAVVIVGKKRSYFFTDGRYILQAQNQLDLNDFEIINMADKSVVTWIIENLDADKKLALDAKLASVNFVKSCKKSAGELVFLDSNPVDKIWKSRPKAPNSPIYGCDKKLTGIDSITKRAQVLEGLEADALIITKPENICWLLNIRAADVEFTPFLLAYGILFKSGEVEIFAEEKRLEIPQNPDLQQVSFLQPNCLDSRIAVLRKSLKKIQIDEKSTNYWLYDILHKNQFEIVDKTNSIEIIKACKNTAEIFGAIKSHEIDGLAVTKFLFWLQQNQQTDEIKAAEKLLEFRKKSADFLYPSFDTISGFASNGAVIHYRASNETNKEISGNSLYLVDSGGQYFGEDFFGTTDITRTISIGKPSFEMIENFTRVLKGHIALARAKFPRGTSGSQLDALARNHLWQAGLDFEHGTGHGVGSFLSVHEGPCGISKHGNQELLEGMILSNEPGFYKPQEYGIRIENLMLVEEFNKKFLQFRTLTLVPFDPELIDFKMLTYPEKKWLRNYHSQIEILLSEGLESEEKIWLQNLVAKFA